MKRGEAWWAHLRPPIDRGPVLLLNRDSATRSKPPSPWLRSPGPAFGKSSGSILGSREELGTGASNGDSHWYWYLAGRFSPLCPLYRHHWYRLEIDLSAARSHNPSSPTCPAPPPVGEVTSSPQPIPSAGSVIVGTPLDLPPDEKAAYQMIFERFRRRTGVRRLNPQESDLKLEDVPRGVFGFVDGGELSIRLRSREGYPLRLQRLESGGDFEIHVLENGTTYVVGFVGKETADTLSRPNVVGREFTFYSNRWKAATEIAAIPLEMLSLIDSRRIDIGERSYISVRAFDVKLRSGKSKKTD